MSTIVLRPDLKTPGGEICDILINGRYAGNLTLVYRENDRIGGAVQLEGPSLSAGEKQQVTAYVHDYIQEFITAVSAKDCDVIVTNSVYDHVIATDSDELGQAKVAEESHAFNSGDEIEAAGSKRARRGRKGRRNAKRPAVFELVIVGESRNKVEYHIYRDDTDWVAEALFQVRGSDVSGELDFVEMPEDDEIEAVADLIVSDFDEQFIDTFDIVVTHKGRELERIELTHEDLHSLSEGASVTQDRSERYSITLARDDGDILTYEIYDSHNGSLPVGTATVDIGHRQLSGFIDLQERRPVEEQETMATLLMRELDKEKDYSTFNLSIMHRNEKIDEMLFENEIVSGDGDEFEQGAESRAFH